MMWNLEPSSYSLHLYWKHDLINNWGSIFCASFTSLKVFQKVCRLHSDAVFITYLLRQNNDVWLEERHLVLICTQKCSFAWVAFWPETKYWLKHFENNTARHPSHEFPYSCRIELKRDTQKTHLVAKSLIQVCDHPDFRVPYLQICPCASSILYGQWAEHVVDKMFKPQVFPVW